MNGDAPPEPTGLNLEGRLLAWIEGGLLVTDDLNPLALDRIFLIDPASGRREVGPSDPTGIMNVLAPSFAVTPDGSAYGYGWHRAVSELYVIDGLGLESPDKDEHA